MANQATRIRRMLRAVRSQVKCDLRELAEDVLQHPLDAGHAVSQNAADVRDLDVQYLKTELVLRTMASRYALLSRIDRALGPADEASSAGSGYDDECAVSQRRASSEPAAV